MIREQIENVQLDTKLPVVLVGTLEVFVTPSLSFCPGKRQVLVKNFLLHLASPEGRPGFYQIFKLI